MRRGAECRSLNRETLVGDLELRDYALVNFPQMWSMKTEAMKSSDITSTGTGPLKFYTQE